MEEEEKIDYRLHLHKQIDNLVESGISVYDLDVVNKKAIRHNYILKSKIKEKIEDAVKKRDFYLKTDREHILIPLYNERINILNELLEGK